VGNNLAVLEDNFINMQKKIHSRFICGVSGKDRVEDLHLNHLVG